MSNYYHCSNYTVILLTVPYTISIQLFRVATVLWIQCLQYITVIFNRNHMTRVNGVVYCRLNKGAKLYWEH